MHFAVSDFAPLPILKVLASRDSFVWSCPVSAVQSEDFPEPVQPTNTTRGGSSCSSPTLWAGAEPHFPGQHATLDTLLVSCLGFSAAQTLRSSLAETPLRTRASYLANPAVNSPRSTEPSPLISRIANNCSISPRARPNSESLTCSSDRDRVPSPLTSNESKTSCGFLAG